MSLHLVVPAHSRSASVIHAYFDLVDERRGVYYPNAWAAKNERAPSITDPRRESALRRFDEAGLFALFEWIPRFLDEYVDWSTFYEHVRDGDDTTITDEDRLRAMAEMFRSAADRAVTAGGVEMQGGLEYTPEEIRYETETGILALLDFAAERGFGVRLSE